MSNLFIAFGFISFGMFLYTVKKTVRHQRHLLKATSTPSAQETDNVEKYLEEDWAEIEKIFRQNSTKK